MRGAPVSPGQWVEWSEGEDELLDDAALERGGWAHGLGAWEQRGKAYEWYLSQGGGDHPSGLDNAQMWSLRKAIRRELIEELLADDSRGPALRDLGVGTELA